MDFSLCPYKTLTGKPNEGSHSYRLFNLSIFDTVVTIAVCYGISKYYKLEFSEVLIIAFLMGIISHHLFCVDTTIEKILFPKP